MSTEESQPAPSGTAEQTPSAASDGAGDATNSDIVQNGLRLQPDEQVLMAFHPSGWLTAGLYFWTLGLYKFWRVRNVFVLTNQRILVRKGRISKIERSLPVQFVQDATVVSALGAGGVRVETAGATRSQLSTMMPLKGDEAHRFADAIMAQANAARGGTTTGAPPAAPTPPDTYDQLRKLGELHDSGVLTDEEFEAQKAELLQSPNKLTDSSN
jgi:hypothetical protein